MYAGMTHLGLNSAAAAAARGFNVVCFDTDSDIIEKIQRGELSIEEPLLVDTLNENAERLTFTSEVNAIKGCDVVYVAPDVATNEANQSDLNDLLALLDVVTVQAREDSAVIILSQVPPGFTRSKNVKGRTLFCQVETLIFGNAIERALNPERIIIGCLNPSKPLYDGYRKFLETFECPLLPMRYESAELAKISINCFLVASVSTTNTLAELCEKIGADWEEIVPALRLDKRIGPYAYLNPGLGIAGGNLERDLETVVRFSKEQDTDADVVKAWISNSRQRKRAAVRVLEEYVLPNHQDPLIAVWGLAYKENTHSIKNSASLETISTFPNCQFHIHDPIVPIEKAQHPRALGFDYPMAAAVDADVLLVLTPWPEYAECDMTALAAAMSGKTVFDPFGVLNSRQIVQSGLNYHSLGKAPIWAE